MGERGDIMRLVMNEFAFGQTQEKFADFERARQQEASKSFARKQQPFPEEDTTQQIFHVRNMINNIIVVQSPTEQERISQQSREQQGSIGEAIGSAIVEFIFDLIAGGKK